ncbi:MAG TPA: protein translocase SEC61 complex subunit gamma [Conexivisphaerales archaeon]|nr:protein translocase SEC61 complex subunit gamma [Conexivisphaerales archaeon]
MNISASIRELINTLKYSKKSDSTEYMLYLKLVLLGVVVVGGLAFAIHIVATMISNFLAPKSTAAILTVLGLVV